jgi:endonuclease/exonuclease/phosphatase family metal-dependent hydrolase
MNPMAGISKEMRVTIVGVNTDTGVIMVRDTFGNEITIDAANRPKGTGFPHDGEQWSMTKVQGQWYLKTQMGAPAIPTITGSRNGLHPILNQMLDALTSHGMVVDQTTFEPVDAGLADPIPYAPGDPDYLDPTVGSDPTGEPPVTGAIPVNFQGPSINVTPAPISAPTGIGGYTAKLVPLYAGTFSIYRNLGPRTFLQDITRLDSTRMQIVGLQDCAGEERNTGFAQFAELGWSIYRPKTATYSDACTIAWRTELFDLLDSGVQNISTGSIAGMPTRYLNWVKVRFKPANRVLYFASVALNPHLDVKPYSNKHTGKPNFDQYSARVTDAIAGINTVAGKIQTFNQTAPVILVGNLNIGAKEDAKVRYKGFPAARFGKVGARSNYAAMDHDPVGKTLGDIDQIWLSSGSRWHVRFVEHWGLTGYSSDHYPLMTEFLVRGKS